ncbi:hypothetical protein [Streptomyces sp. JH34]|uniref:hypothetical protein n=1 Tax=unclassified Streptomyces TaxID=2593676 RepID=UPI0023F9BB9D|nr:hypothetical protein [Streptomyces sp. JH34]MDF6023067.1 hypothetical protein [Streptomyces sp. JH34]
MTNYAELHPARIPGYHDGPFSQRTELLRTRLFWLGHLYPSADGEAGELLFGPDYPWSDHRNFQRRLRREDDWPTFTVPLGGESRLHVVYRTVEEEAGVDYLVHHPDWDRAELLAQTGGNFTGPGLSWRELAAAAYNRLPGGTTTDPHARLLLLLPAFGDDAVPAQNAVCCLAEALSACLGMPDTGPLADAILEHQGLTGRVRWVTTDGRRTNDGMHSFRNPASHNALPDERLTRVSAALAG